MREFELGRGVAKGKKRKGEKGEKIAESLLEKEGFDVKGRYDIDLFVEAKSSFLRKILSKLLSWASAKRIDIQVKYTDRVHPQKVPTHYCFPFTKTRMGRSDPRLFFLLIGDHKNKKRPDVFIVPSQVIEDILRDFGPQDRFGITLDSNIGFAGTQKNIEKGRDLSRYKDNFSFKE